MNRSIRVCGKRANSFGKVHSSSSGQVPHLKGILKNQCWNKRGQAKMVGVQEAYLEERMSEIRDLCPGQEKWRNTFLFAEALIEEEGSRSSGSRSSNVHSYRI